MAFKNGTRKNLSEKEIKEQIKNSKNYKKDNTPPSKTLLLFENSNQKAWLIKTDKRVYKVLDDRRKKEATISWSIERGTNINIREEKINENVGKLYIGSKGKTNENLYRRDIFSKEKLNSEIQNLIHIKDIKK